MGTAIGIGFFTGCILLWFIEKWPDWVLPKLYFNQSFTLENCYVGDSLVMTWKIGNKGRLPVTWIKLDTEFSPHISIDGVSANQRDWMEFKGINALPAQAELKYEYTCTFHKRGYYLFKDLKYETADYLGIKSYEGRLSDRTFLYVYPSLRPVEALIDKSQQYMGDKEIRRWVVEDPLIHTGSREYTGSDPMKHIHWNATAQMGSLQVKKFAFTTELSAMLLLNSQTKDNFWDGTEDELLERMVETAAAYVDRFEKSGESYGFSSNCPVQEGAGGVMISAAKGRKHYHKVFRALSQMTHYSNCSMEDIVAYNVKQVPKTTRLILVTGIMNDRILQQVFLNLNRGYDFEIITTRAVIDTWAGKEPRALWYGFKEGVNEQ